MFVHGLKYRHQRKRKPQLFLRICSQALYAIANTKEILQ